MWLDFHPHDFIFQVELKPIVSENEIHGIDMVRAERSLIQYVEQLPEKVNDHPICPNGTTEQLCDFLAGFAYQDAILLSVRVGETPNRFTVKDINHE